MRIIFIIALIMAGSCVTAQQKYQRPKLDPVDPAWELIQQLKAVDYHAQLQDAPHPQAGVVPDAPRVTIPVYAPQRSRTTPRVIEVYTARSSLGTTEIWVTPRN